MLLSLLTGGLVAIGIVTLRRPAFHFLRTNRTFYCWLLAFAIYGLVTGGLYAFVRWCEAAVM